jgi:phage virion morphogenesis protein
MNVRWQLLSTALEARLAKMKAAGIKPTAALAALGRVLANRIRLGFRMGRSPWGVPWAPLKLRAGQPLRDTGRLQRSITHQVQADSVLVGTNVRYARTHQHGAKIKPVKGKFLRFPGPGGRPIFSKGVQIPARPFMPIVNGKVDLPAPWAKSALGAMAQALGLGPQKPAGGPA